MGDLSRFDLKLFLFRELADVIGRRFSERFDFLHVPEGIVRGHACSDGGRLMQAVLSARGSAVLNRGITILSRIPHELWPTMQRLTFRLLQFLHGRLAHASDSVLGRLRDLGDQLHSRLLRLLAGLGHGDAHDAALHLRVQVQVRVADRVGDGVSQLRW